MGAPWVASRTVTEQRVFIRCAKGAVKPGGMCCTMRWARKGQVGKGAKCSEALSGRRLKSPRRRLQGRWWKGCPKFLTRSTGEAFWKKHRWEVNSVIARGSSNLGYEILPNMMDVERGGRQMFRYIVEGPCGERVEGLFRVLLCQIGRAS